MNYNLDGICQECIYLEKIKPLFEEKDKEIERLNHECDTYMKIATNKQKLLDFEIERNDIKQDKIDKALNILKTTDNMFDYEIIERVIDILEK